MRCPNGPQIGFEPGKAEARQGCYRSSEVRSPAPTTSPGIFRPLVLAIEDEGDRRHNEQVFWETTPTLAELFVGNMMRTGP